ncbi:DUF2570 domain-containing protein [Enterobacter hormaechei]|uniref:DUF2570 domain-containing protein n=1 Tax=Enterobacter hormaechei TaxID=158836 RepID=UPI002949A4F1|nr:DUF2570 domain-containing protein [Enterobacter hormaechei]MDV5713874.1 DUF2570 domain-containing protein [Enterobacter hormaechei]
MSRLTAIICAFVICLLVSMAWMINYYRDNAITYKDQRDKATVRADTSEAITNNVITTMNLIRDISQATQNAKNELAQKGETRIIYIRQALEGDPCANQFVPSAAADSLREYADSLRSGPGGADKR